MKKHKEHYYIEAICKGDNKIIEEIYRRFANQTIKWIQNNNGTVTDAKDVFQDALMAIFLMACEKDFVLTCPFGALLHRICRNKWFDKISKKKKETEVRKLELDRYSNETTVDTLTETIEEEELKQKKLDASFHQLSELCQKLLIALTNGISPKQVALDLDMTNANTVYRRKKACIERWKTLFNQEKS